MRRLHAYPSGCATKKGSLKGIGRSGGRGCGSVPAGLPICMVQRAAVRLVATLYTLSSSCQTVLETLTEQSIMFIGHVVLGTGPRHAHLKAVPSSDFVLR